MHIFKVKGKLTGCPSTVVNQQEEGNILFKNSVKFVFMRYGSVYFVCDFASNYMSIINKKGVNKIEVMFVFCIIYFGLDCKRILALIQI